MRDRRSPQLQGSSRRPRPAPRRSKTGTLRKYLQAVELLEGGNESEAVETLRRAILAEPLFTEAIALLAETCTRLGWFDELVGGLEDAYGGGNKGRSIIEALILYSLEGGDFDRADRYLLEYRLAHPRWRKIGPLDIFTVRSLIEDGRKGRLRLGRRRARRPSPRRGSAETAGAPARGSIQAGRSAPKTPPVSKPAPPPARVAPPPPAPVPEPSPILSRATPDPIRVEVTVEPDTLCERLARDQMDGPERYGLSLSAHRLSMLGNLDELLCLSRLHDVRQLSYQVETVRKVLRRFRGRALLCDEVGLGKTIEAGMIIKEYLLRGIVRSILVLVPPALVHQWTEEMAAKFDIHFSSTADRLCRRDADAFWEMNRLVVASTALVRTGRHRDRVVSTSFDLIIVDEAHHLRNRATEAWKLVNRLKSPFLLLLTATPLQNNLEELHNLITLLKPGQLATRAAFLREFVSKEDPTRPVNEEKLRALLSEVMVRNTRALSGLHLPPRHARTLVCDPTAQEAELYDALSALVRARFSGASSGSGGEDGDLSRFTLRLLQSEAGSSPAALARTLSRIEAGRAALPEQAGSEADRLGAELRRIREMAANLHSHSKVEALVEALRGEREKTIVFVTWLETLHFVEAGLRRAGIEPVLFHGGMDAEEKEAAIERFRTGAKVLLTTEVGGEGRNLQFCHRMVNFDLPWNPMRIEQRIGRLHRIGQEREIEILNLCARGSVEDHLLDLLDRKINLFELVIGEVDMILGRLEDRREFSERVMEAWAAAVTEEDAAGNFSRLGEEIGRAKADYERIKTLDQKLFGEDYEA